MPCQICGAQPAIEVKFRQNTGMILLMRMGRRQGTLCRSCGLAIGRRTQNYTLLAGWWGIISFFFNFYVVTMNALALRQLDALPVPPPSPPRQLNPGQPIWRRPGILVAGLAVVIAGVVIGYYAGTQSHNSALENAQPGQCVAMSSDGSTVTGVVDCAQTHGGTVVAQNADGTCPTGANAYAITNSDGSTTGTATRVLCVTPGQ